jgi:hypothetical protein
MSALVRWARRAGCGAPWLHQRCCTAVPVATAYSRRALRTSAACNSSNSGNGSQNKPGDQRPPHASLLSSSSSSNSNQNSASNSQRSGVPDSSSSSSSSVNTESIFYTGELDDDDRYDSDSGNAFDDGLESEADDEYAGDAAGSDGDDSDGFVGAKYIASNDPEAANKVSAVHC